MKKAPLLLFSSLLGCALFSACPPPGGHGGGGGGGGSLNANACGDFSTMGTAARRLHAFLVASADLDRDSAELENSVLGACRKMAVELGINPTGDTRTVCNAVSAELDANLKVSVSTEKRLVTREVPGECHTEMSFAADVSAKCEAQANVNASLTCDGRCGGTCNGACNGTCAGGGSGGQCNSQCDGVCNGSCTGNCDGNVSGGASAECRASVNIESSVHTVCTEPKLVVEEESVTVVDASKFAKAQAAIQAGLPTIRKAAMKAALVAKAGVEWANTLGSLVTMAPDVVAELGTQAVCVGAQLQAALSAATQIQARFSVSIEVSASISGSAGVQ